MTRPSAVAAAGSLALLLGGCGGTPVPGREDGADPANVAAASAPVSPVRAAEAPAAPAAVAGGLRGQVSGLAADTSGLNVRVTDYGTVVDLPADALFEFDRAELTPAAEAELRKAADLIRRAPAGEIAVIGHTDARGDDAYNLELSRRRAAAVAAWFGTQVGVRQRGLRVEGRGEAEPVAPNAAADGADDPAGRARNRRVEVVIPTG